MRILLIALLLSLFSVAQQEEKQLWQHRNLGKAYYENTATLPKSVEQFRKALRLAPDSPREQLNYALALLRNGEAEEAVKRLREVQQTAPRIPHTWFNLGVHYKREGQYEKAIEQFEGHVQRAPEIAVSHYNLGVLYRLTGRVGEAIKSFQRAARLDHNLAAPHFQLAHLYRSQGQLDKSSEEMETFRRLKEAQKSAPIAEDLEWSIHAEILDPIDREPAPGDGVPELRWETRDIGEQASGDHPGLYALARHPEAFHIAGDANDDGYLDLCLVQGGQARLLWGGDEGFQEPGEILAEGAFQQALWLDFDHDYDLDLFLFGDSSRLLRNEGGQGFADRSERFPFQAGAVTSAAFHDAVKDWEGMDIAVAFKDRRGIIYRDHLGGRYTVEPLEELPPGARRLTSFDIDNDGHSDLLFSDDEGLALLRKAEGGYRLKRISPSDAPYALADLENRGWPDLILGAKRLRNLGLGRFGPARPLPVEEPPRSWLPGDFNADGRFDLALLDAQGRLKLLENNADTGHGWVKVELTGTRNLDLAHHAEVEVKAAGLYQKRIYRGRPLHFGLGGQERIDTIRITWPNGLIQNEPLPEMNRQHSYREAKQLSGSCPMVFTWDGAEFRFIGDILGVAPLGAASGDGKVFQADHDEYIQIPSDALKPRDGMLEVRLTEELREVAYLDQIRLLAVDHPEGSSVFTSDKFKAPPFPEFRLYQVRRRIGPKTALDHNRRDVLSLVLERDGRHVRGFTRDERGVAEEHFLELDFGVQAPADSLLVLHGWLDWPDASTFVRSDQSGLDLAGPRLEALDAQGRWRTILPDLGAPAGKSKTIVAELSGLWPGPSRKLRIVTRWSLYWDEAFLTPDTGRPDLQVREVPLARAVLDYRGFSRAIVDPERRHPDRFDYSDWRPYARWNPARGLYTRLGPVEELLSRVDDRMAVMGAGDELRLSFDPSALPPVPPGQRRQWLLYADGWVKDGDFNTAHSQTVEPLPFHGMTGYPYGREEKFPGGEQFRLYRERYQRRPALRPHQPLADDRPKPRPARERKTP